MKKLLILPVMVLMTVLLGSMATALFDVNCTLNETLTGHGNVLKHKVTINASVNASANSVNCSYWYLSSKSGAAWTTLGDNISTSTTTGTNEVFLKTNETVPVWAFDIYTQQFRVTCGSGDANGTGTCTATTAIAVDNSVPVIVTPSPADMTKDVDGAIDFSISCKNSSSATLVIEGTSYTMTVSGSDGSESCARTGIKLYTNGFHSWYVFSSDGTNTTAGSTVKVEVRRPGTLTPEMREARLAEEAARAKPRDFKSFVKSFFDSIFSLIDRIFKRG